MRRGIACLIAILSSAGVAARADAPKTAEELGLMRGFPPPADKQVTHANLAEAPYNRWAFQHMRELLPSRALERGDGPVAALPRGEPLDLRGLSVDLPGEQSMKVSTWMYRAYTDAFLVLHRGRIVYEAYFNDMTPETPHQMMSVSKSFCAAVVLTLIEEGKIDTAAPVSRYVPELGTSAYGDASVQQVLDMTVGVAFDEDYRDPKSEWRRFGYALGLYPPPAGYDGPMNLYSYLPTLRKSGEHGEAFHYVSADTEVLGWIAERASGAQWSRLLSERLWRKLGVEHDAYYWLDPAAREGVSAALNISARDAARFGQMILERGTLDGRRVLSKTVAERILQPGDPAPFNRFYQDRWYAEVGYAYHDQWWTFRNEHKSVAALGIHGQHIYIDPVAEMVIVRQSSDPQPESDISETDGPIVYHVIAKALMAR